MELIKLEQPFNKKDYIKSNMILWKIQSKKIRKSLIGVLTATIIIGGIGIISISETEPSNPFLFIGLVFSILSLVYFMSTMSTKRRFKYKVEENADKMDKKETILKFEMSADYIKYEDGERKLEYKWEAFTSYSFYDKYILLTIGDNILNSFLLDKEDFTSSENDDLINQLKLKLDYREIK